MIDGYEEGCMYRSKDDIGVDNNALFGIRMVLVCSGCACFPASYQESER